MIKRDLPIETVLEEIRQQLLLRDEVVLVAPPGAGKTTLAPLALMAEPWLGTNKILMLEPRRLATRGAAYRMSSLIGESPGATVGYRMRLDTKVSSSTIIEVITEGTLTRMLQEDPSLANTGLVIFDEFHERNLDSDLALALCLKSRSIFRDEDNPLKLMIMSATLDSDAICGLLNDAPIIRSEGRQYPVELVYGKASQAGERIADRTTVVVKQAITDNPDSSLLVFLPGQAEIARVATALSTWLAQTRSTDIQVHPLFGNLSFEAQQQAISPVQRGERKIVLATNIAETSLTIEGIDVVVDSGLARAPLFDTATGMTRLQTVRISASSSVQRMGRAGRTQPGKCYRLWTRDQQAQLAAHNTPEILQADLASLAVQLLQWGISDPDELQWLDRPPISLWRQAISLLESLGALDFHVEDRRDARRSLAMSLSKHGERMASLPVHPRIAHMLVSAVQIQRGAVAAHLASLLSDRNPLTEETPDISVHLEMLENRSVPRKHNAWLQRTLRLAQQFQQQLSQLVPETETQNQIDMSDDAVPGFLLACAYPDRIARRRHSEGYQLANGRGASLQNVHSLGKASWLAIAEVTGVTRSKGDTIRCACKLDPELFNSQLAHVVDEQEIADWDPKLKRFNAYRRKSIGELTLVQSRLENVSEDVKAAALIRHLRDGGFRQLNWSAPLRQWQARVTLAGSMVHQQSFPDVTDEALIRDLESWLAPYLGPVKSLDDLKKLELPDILMKSLPYNANQLLNQLVPTHFRTPAGAERPIDYTVTPPVLAVKLQEMFGCEHTPMVMNGQVKLLVHLLSPAGRPLQITQDLSGFWRSGYHDVAKDMRGRYPKHPWPIDPLTAQATSRTRNHHG